MDKKARKNYFVVDFFDMRDTVSSCECTGLMPTPPKSGAQQAAYEALFSMEVAQSEEEAERRRC